ncbi:DNA-processing protein DprA [Enterococcus diestrammenae]|uniref:DNA protecting protein DprA n=1 Tax=Enterococcus diestrammenae TaxID=1155073 RepID=A0ABV0F3D4_9ENTE|nr:DNA-processing protein DprA [Enterococcus diestrammenae]KAF1300403.1 DNA protecting protein DprA [Enterococcus diestrammenae]
MSREVLLVKLALCQGMGIEKKWRLLQYAQHYQRSDLSFQEILQVLGYNRFSETLRQNWQSLTPDEINQRMLGQKYLSYDSPLYPTNLKEIAYPPLVLFYEGRKELLQKRLVAFVGARDATAYGKRVIDFLVPEVVRANYVVVSGLAKGIDSCAHEAAMVCGGYTIGVLGTGVDLCYPSQSRPIYQKMKKEHLLISEYPRGTTPQKHHFPMRNRIIAGLSQGLCVIEAKSRSGSLITAQQALEDGREVFAVPGDVLTGHSAGCHDLIQDGAKCVHSPEDILSELPQF